MKRKSISKRVRFSVFARDAFTCRYCGRQTDEVKLVIDHLIAVSKGGTNDEENLVTSCEGCNSGKSNLSIEQAAPNETDRLRKLQETREQRQTAEAISEAVKKKVEAKQAFVNAWCGITGRPSVDRGTIGIIYSYVEDFGFELVYRWVEIAFARVGSYCDKKMGRYISGIRRRHIEEQEAES